ncbi:MAG: phosphatase PAP2 family protein [Candidatus Aminicenantes bacterium]|jgi:membrane-associated phospholipid phosphatase
MFQTELILFLQSFETDILNHFFLFWSEVGFSRWIWFFMLVFLFGVSFRYGFILMQAMLWNGLTSLWFKNIFALPRPAHVDLNVKLIGENVPNLTPFESRGAGNFFNGLPRDVVTSLRAAPPGSWGLPSGHTSNATVMGGLFFAIYRKLWIKLLAVAVVVFVPLSRMYLGRHFLADVLAGYVIGFAFVLLFYKGVIKNVWLFSFLSRRPQHLRWDSKIILLLFYMGVLPLVLLFLPKINIELVAALLGLNIGFLLVWNRGIPEDMGAIGQRIARVFLAIGVYILSDRTLDWAVQLFFEPRPAGVAFVKNSLTVLLCVWGSTELAFKLRLFQRRSI